LELWLWPEINKQVCLQIRNHHRKNCCRSRFSRGQFMTCNVWLQSIPQDSIDFGDIKVFCCSQFSGDMMWYGSVHHKLLNALVFFLSLRTPLFPKTSLVSKTFTPYFQFNVFATTAGFSWVGNIPRPPAELHQGTGKECTTSTLSVPTWRLLKTFSLGRRK